MSNAHQAYELIVAEDGSIPADQLTRLGLAPGAHLRIMETEPRKMTRSLRGALRDFPDLSEEDFRRASDLAISDLNAS